MDSCMGAWEGLMGWGRAGWIDLRVGVRLGKPAAGSQRSSSRRLFLCCNMFFGAGA